MAFAKKAAIALLSTVPAARAVSLQAHRAGEGSCACIPWADAYTSEGGTCGAGKELKLFGMENNKMAKFALPAAMYDEFCTRFYMRSRHNSCYNPTFGPSEKQWCYVPSGCGGKPVEGTKMEVHECSKEAGDSLMRDKTPEELNQMALKSDLEIGLFGKMSYAKNNLKWSEVEGASTLPEDKMKASHIMESHYGLKWHGPADVTPEHRQEFEDAIKSGDATIFDTDNGHGGGTLILGDKIYGFLQFDKRMGYGCLKGC